MSKHRRKWPALSFLAVTVLTFLAGELLLFLAKRTQVSSAIAIRIRGLELKILAGLLLFSFPLLFPRQVYTVFRAADIWERKHIWKKEGPSEKYPAEPPSASLRNIRLIGLIVLLLIFGIVTYVECVHG